jgi:hypothetical protein
MLLHVSGTDFFLLLSNILLYEFATIYSFASWWIFGLSNFWTLRVKLL